VRLATWFLLAPLGLVAQTDYRQQFEAWLAAEAGRHWDARDRAIAAIDSRQKISERQAYIRKTALNLIGGLPAEKTPLNAKVTGSFSRDGYRVENVIFESQPGFRVTANLYLPTTSAGPHPAVLGVAGHSTNGKASSTYQKAFIGFVKRGIAVLAYDPPGQGERLEYLDRVTGKSRAGIGVGEHLMAGVPTLLTGQTIARHFVWDGIRAFDYLLTRPEIDSKRVAVAGNSGGGTQSAYLALFEPRLANAISSCYMTNWRELWSGPGPQDSEQIWPGFLSSGLDFGDFALALAPRPYLITSAIRDYFPIAGARATHKQMARLFDQLGGGANLGFFDYDDTHGWSQPRREAASRWLEKHFFGRDSEGAEAVSPTEEESRLYATASGQLATSVGSRTMQELSIEQARQLAKGRKSLTLAGIRAAVGWVEPAALTPVFRPQGGQGIELGVEGGVRIAARLDRPSVSKGIVVYLGATSGAADGDRDELVKDRLTVITVHPRGSGPGYPVAGSSGYNFDYQIAARTWLLGRNLLAMQAADIVAGVRYANQMFPAEPVFVFAKGRLGPAGLLAAVLEPRISRLLLESSIQSLQGIVEAPMYHSLENAIVPGVLAHFDLADLRRLVAPRAIMEVSPVTPDGQIMRAGEFLVRGEGWTLARTVADFFIKN